jgi:NAD(P)-dependent dehydrogenase (short-subunit alcohol dehydrogenase family)
MTTLASGTPIVGAAALVTGGSRGFGLALVHELLSRGAARVYATSRTPASSPDPRVIPLVLDVTDETSVQAAALAAPDVSILINNAGVLLRSNVLTSPLDEIRAELDTNLFGIIRASRAFAPVLARHASSSMVNVLSALSWLTLGGGYEISKSAAWSATNALRFQLAPQGTTVTGLHVGYMDTEMVAALDVSKTDPRAVARQTADAILTGAYEILADETARRVKSALSAEVSALYPQLAAPSGRDVNGHQT